MLMNNRKSTNTFASYRLFMLLKFLSDNKASVKDIVNYLESIDPDKRRYSVITVYKYLNSVKAMGFKLIRNNRLEYSLSKQPFTFKFSKNSLHALKLLEIYSKHTEEENLKADLTAIVNKIKNSLDTESYALYEDASIDEIEVNNKYSDDCLNLVNRFEQYIKDDLKLCISYKEDKNTIKRVIASPIEIEDKENKVYFVVYDSTRGQNIFLAPEKITEIEQLPQKTYGKAVPVTVMYEIKGRLKNRYVLKKYESLYSSDENTAVIINKGEDKDKLIKRLIGYCDLCRIISPKSYVNDMKSELDLILKNYEE